MLVRNVAADKAIGTKEFAPSVCRLSINPDAACRRVPPVDRWSVIRKLSM